MKNSRLVYSTETGKVCPKCKKAVSVCTCSKRKTKAVKTPVHDGIIRIQREVKGRKGKTVTAISGFGPKDDLKTILLQLKRRCGTGGAIKDGRMLIQGDHRTTLKAELEAKGYLVKLAGG